MDRITGGDSRNIDWLLHRPVAHRGYHSGDGRIPENSLASFEEALGRGFPIEMDVRLLKDGHVAVFHDENAFRMTGIDSEIGELVSSDLKNFKLLGSHERIPLLEEALDLVNCRTPLLLEIKNSKDAGALEEGVSEALQRYGGRCAVQSFNPRSVRWFRDNFTRVPRGQLSGTLEDLDIGYIEKLLLQNLLVNRMGAPHFVGYESRMLPNLPVRVVRGRGTPIIAWTVCSREERMRVRAFCDNIIFEGFDPTLPIDER
jgi:glycerophosphoryl diester phosphodiesterase